MALEQLLNVSRALIVWSLCAALPALPLLAAADQSSSQAMGQAQAQPEKPEPKQSLGARQTAFWLLAGTAGLFAISGSVFALRTRDERARHDENSGKEPEDRAKAMRVGSALAFGVAGAAALAAAFVWLSHTGESLAPQASPPKPPKTEASIDPAGATFRLTF